MLKKTLESKLLKIEKKAMKANEKDYRTQLKETKKAKSWDEFGKSYSGKYYLANSAADRLYILNSERLNKAKKEQDLKKFKEVFIKLLEKTYKKDLKKFGVRWAGIWAAARSVEPEAIGWREVNTGGTSWKTRAAVSGGTNRGAGECSVAYGYCVHGGGYDKCSTATANALNQIRQALGVALRVQLQTGERFSGFEFWPRNGGLWFPGGVGSNSYVSIFERAGYKSAGISFNGVFNLIKK